MVSDSGVVGELLLDNVAFEKVEQGGELGEETDDDADAEGEEEEDDTEGYAEDDLYDT